MDNPRTINTPKCWHCPKNKHLGGDCKPMVNIQQIDIGVGCEHKVWVETMPTECVDKIQR